MNRHERRAARAQARTQPKDERGYSIPFAGDASPLVKSLVPRVLRASLEGIGKGGDLEHEERVHACFMVACAHIAHIDDDEMQRAVAAGYAESIARSVESMREMTNMIASCADDRGMTEPELMQAMQQDGVVTPMDWPDEPREQ
jgi:hypothetical protein